VALLVFWVVLLVMISLLIALCFKVWLTPSSHAGQMMGAIGPIQIAVLD
jgi:hypothetical protein